MPADDVALIRRLASELRAGGETAERLRPAAGGDQPAAVIWGELMGAADRAGRPRAAADRQIAATALRHDTALATRNTADFEGTIPALLNPRQ